MKYLKLLLKHKRKSLESGFVFEDGIKKCDESVFSLPLFLCGFFTSVYYFFQVGFLLISTGLTFWITIFLDFLKGIFTLSGLIFIDKYISENTEYPKKFREVNCMSIIRTFSLIIAFLLFIIIVGYMSIENSKILSLLIAENLSLSEISALLAPFVEELFFRGVLLTIFIFYGRKKKFANLADKKQKINVYKILGIFFSSFLFAIVHIQYYWEPVSLIEIFFLGLINSIIFIHWRDLTTCVLFHLFVNLFALRKLLLLSVFVVIMGIYYIIIIIKNNRKRNVKMIFSHYFVVI